MRPLRLGLIGLGTISRFYLHALDHIPSMRLAAVCDVDDAALALFQVELPCHHDHREMLRRSDIDAVVVTSPNDSHAPVCRDALQAGLPVCVEKPLAIRLEEGEMLQECARRARVPLFTAFHRRYNSSIVALARRLSTSAPVEWLSVRYMERIEDHIGRDRWYLDPARCGGGCVADNGANAYDLARFFLGDLEVTDVCVDRDDQGIDRQARVELRSASGAGVETLLDWSYGGERKDVDVRLADGSCDRADMLAGHSEFKGSLRHEYVGVLNDFQRVVNLREHTRDGGLPNLALVETTYRAEQSSRHAYPSTTKT